MIILGIDPGYAIIGYGVLEYSNNHFKVLDFGAVTTPAGMPFNRRLEIIYDELDAVMNKHKPDVMAIEKLFFENRLYSYHLLLDGLMLFYLYVLDHIVLILYLHKNYINIFLYLRNNFSF